MTKIKTKPRTKVAVESLVSNSESRAYKVAPALEPFLVPIDSITLDDKNARRHPAKNLHAIRDSLVRFGWQKPVVIDKDNVVRAGNGQVMAARELKWTHVPVVQSQLTGADLIAYAIADNRTGDLSTWDQDVLAELVSSLADIKLPEEIDVQIPGFDSAEIDMHVKFQQNADERADIKDTLDEIVEAPKPDDLPHGTVIKFNNSVMLVACPINDLSSWRSLLTDETEFVVPYAGLLAPLGDKFIERRCLFIQPHGGAAAFFVQYLKKRKVKVTIAKP